MEGLWLGFNGLVVQYLQDCVDLAMVLRLAFGGIEGSGLLLRFW